MTISSDLRWNSHGNEIVKEAARRLYFLVQLKRAKLPNSDSLLFYRTCIRYVLAYAVPVFCQTLPLYLKYEIEQVQKRALVVIYPVILYSDASEHANIPTVDFYCEAIGRKTFYQHSQ